MSETPSGCEAPLRLSARDNLVSIADTLRGYARTDMRLTQDETYALADALAEIARTIPPSIDTLVA